MTSPALPPKDYFTHHNVRYKLFSEFGGQLTPVTDPKLIESIGKVFEETVGQRRDVAKASFEAGKEELRVSYYNKVGDLLKNTETVNVAHMIKGKAEVANVHDYIRLLQSRTGKKTPAMTGDKVGIERKQQTCYAGAFLQCHREYDLGASRAKPANEPDALTKPRDELWQALKDFQEAAKIAKEKKKVIEVKFVEKLLNKAAAVQKAHNSPITWNKFDIGQDFSDLWAFVREELNMPELSHFVHDPSPSLAANEKDHFIQLTLGDHPSVKTLLEVKTFGFPPAPRPGLEVALSQRDAVPPKLLPLKIARNLTGQKDLAPLDIDRELTYTVNGQSVAYELAYAVEQLGDTTTGHYIAYQFEKDAVIQYDDERTKAFVNQDDILRSLKTTATFLIYRLKEE